MDLAIQNDVPLAPLTSLRLGGNARHYIQIQSLTELNLALDWIKSHNHRYYLLSGGSNTIFSDDGFDGVVLHLQIKGRRREGNDIVVSAGEVWDDTVLWAVEQGLSGIECLSGIPGLAGATPVQNVGAYGQEVASTIVSVTGVDLNSQRIETLSNADCHFSYRSSVFKRGKPFIITEVRFSLSGTTAIEPKYDELRSVFEDLFAETEQAVDQRLLKLQLMRKATLLIRRRKSMVIDDADPDSRSAGSFFLNPVLTPKRYQECAAKAAVFNLTLRGYPSADQFKVSAAWLVENAGFHKGFTENGVGISNSHSLALVNRGGSSKALLDLSNKIQEAVLQKFGISLEREPVVVASKSL